MFKAGFDYSWNEASFSCATHDGRILFDSFLELPPRNASALPEWMASLTAAHGFTLNDVSEWSVGSGPGSFTGLRLAAAFVLGLGFGRADIRKRGVSTASAIAASAPGAASREDAKTLALFDGRRGELLAYRLVFRAGWFVPDGFLGIIKSGDSGKLAGFDSCVCLERDRELIGSILGSPIPCAGIFAAKHILASKLISAAPGDFSAPLVKPEYLRPAVFVEPRLPRSL